MTSFFRVFITSIFFLVLSKGLYSQCTSYQINVVLDGACPQYPEITWLLIGSDGTLWYSGGAPYSNTVCLPDDCYTLQMLDTGGDGWECVDWFISDFIGEFDWDTNLPIGNFGMDTFATGAGDCANSGGNGNSCPPGSEAFVFSIDDGDFPGEISWTLSLGGIEFVSGLADQALDLCLGPGCFVLEMFDSAGNGWDGAIWSLEDENGIIQGSGTLSSGSTGYAVINIGGLDCNDVTPGGGGGGGGGSGGGGGGSGCGTAMPGSDCSTAACVCDPYVFTIAPSGFGTFNEIPSPGSTSNPNFNGSPPWGGSDWGCLLAGELNSSWMMFTVETSGVLEFSFGQNSNGGQMGFYDWEMWSYSGVSTCEGISGNTLSPVRCVWNAVNFGGTGLAATLPAGGNSGNYGPPLNVTAGEQFIICFSNWSYATGTVVLDFFGSATIQCGMVLPVDFLFVNAAPAEQDIVVTWVTGTEVNNDKFIVQHSTDGQLWSDLGWIDGSGNSQSAEAYQFRHFHPDEGIHYYRIGQVDFNGEMHLSGVADCSLAGMVVLFPNPADDRVHISGFLNADLHVQVIDTKGRVVLEKTFSEMEEHTLFIESLDDGIYILLARSGGKISSHLISVVHLP